MLLGPIVTNKRFKGIFLVKKTVFVLKTFTGFSGRFRCKRENTLRQR